MFQRIEIIGNLGGDPQLKYTPEGKAVAEFTVAVHRGFKSDKKPIWFRVSTWEKQAESCNQYLQKGSRVFVSGRIDADDEGYPRLWEGRDGKVHSMFEMTAHEVLFLSSDGGTGERGAPKANGIPSADADSGVGVPPRGEF